MNKTIQRLIKEVVQVEISGKKVIVGKVIDVGSDLLVIFNGTNFTYIPLEHIQNFKVVQNNEENIQNPTESPSIKTSEAQPDLTFKETLEIAIGRNTEIYLTDNQPLHGQITSVHDDYFVFYSPIYKTMYIPIAHLKWIIPYFQSEILYGIDEINKLVESGSETLANTFTMQIEKFIHRIVVLNIGGPKSHHGKIRNIDQGIIEIQKERTNSLYLNINHIKTLHLV